MDTSTHHNLKDLFAQLGLAAESDDIEAFLSHHQLAGEDKLEQAGFWNDSQRKFLHDAIAEDSDWCEAVDELDALLRH